MTDWLEEILDRDPGEPVPEGFASRVLERTKPQGRLIRFPSLIAVAAAAAFLMAAGFWIGSGAKPVAPMLGDPNSSDAASLDLAELYSHRDVLQDFEILTDAELELAFQDESAKTWILDETPGVSASSTGEEEQK